MYGATGRYLFANQEGAEAMGKAPAHMIGRHWWELGLPPEIMERFGAMRRAVMADGQIRAGVTDFPTIYGVRT